MERISKELCKELEKLGLIDYTKDNANCYTTCRGKKYVCKNVLSKYEYLKKKRQKEVKK